LETIKREHLPVTFYVFSNNGYNSIRVMQKARFDGHLVGCDPSSGFTMPQLEDLASCYGFMYQKLTNLDDFGRTLVAAPMIIEVMIDPEWEQLPRVMASMVNGEIRTDDMQDMTPKIDNIGKLMQ